MASKGSMFEELSVDVKTVIVQHIHRPSDLKRLCLVNKQLHEITVRQLYYEVTLDVGSQNDTRLAAFLNPRNIGLQWVRKLDLYLADVLDKCGQPEKAHFAVRMILEFLPENILEKFSWHPWSPFSGENLVLLYKKQKRMKWLEGIALDKDVLEELQKIPDSEQVFTNVKKLGLYPDSRAVLAHCHVLLKNSPKVERITLHASFDDITGSFDDISARELNDSSTGPGLITSTMFAHLMPFDKCTPLALREITLQKISLRYAADTYCKFVQFRTVKFIRVFACPGADSLFAELAKSTMLPDKLEGLEFKHDDNTEQEGLSAIDGFLTLVSGLKALTLDFSNAKSLPAVAGINRHTRTLQSLNVHASTENEVDDEHVYDYQAITEICKACKELEQVCLAFPKTYILRDKEAGFRNFEDAILTLPKLVTLNITTWPATSSTIRLRRGIYENILQLISEYMFSTNETNARNAGRSAKLAIIAFGSSDKVYDRENSTNQTIYVKGMKKNPISKEALTAMKMSWCLRKYLDAGPKSDVLDFSLSRSTKPPVKTDGGFESEDSDA